MVTDRACCFELRYANGEPVDTGDCIPHFLTEAAARQAASSYALAELGVPYPHQLDAACVRGAGCAVCEIGLGEDNYVVHFESGAQASEYARQSGWFIRADGAAVCPDCRPAPESKERM
jgi:hypothetical protein